MRIALNAWFWNSPTTGSGQYVRRLVSHLSEVAPDLEVILVAPRRQIDPDDAIRSLKLSNVRAHIVDSSGVIPPNLRKVCFEQIAFPKACSRLAVDLAHVPYWAPPFRPTVPTVVTIHDLIPLLLPEYRGRPLVRLYTALVSRTTHRARLVLTDSEAARWDIVTHLTLPNERVRAIHLAADKRFSPESSPEDATIRQRYGLPERYVLYLGGFDVRKDVKAVLQAWRQVAPTIGQRYPLVIAGQLPGRDTDFAPDPRRQARELRLDETSIYFTGFIDESDKPTLYRSALAFVFPSRYEGFGLPPLEAMACGTPVICCRTASLPEVIGEGGVLVATGDGAGIANALLELAANPELRDNMSHKAIRQAARFSWTQTARETLAAYRDL